MRGEGPGEELGDRVAEAIAAECVRAFGRRELTHPSQADLLAHVLFGFPVQRGGLLLPVLVLPLTIPVLIFGVAASNAAIVGPIPFGTPFTILCALTLMSAVVGPIAAAATLRQGLD